MPYVDEVSLSLILFKLHFRFDQTACICSKWRASVAVINEPWTNSEKRSFREVSAYATNAAQRHPDPRSEEILG